MNTVLSKPGVLKLLSWRTNEFLYLNMETESRKTD